MTGHKIKVPNGLYRKRRLKALFDNGEEILIDVDPADLTAETLKKLKENPTEALKELLMKTDVEMFIKKSKQKDRMLHALWGACICGVAIPFIGVLPAFLAVVVGFGLKELIGDYWLKLGRPDAWQWFWSVVGAASACGVIEII